MANGQPRPAFYVAVLLVVIGLVGLALWRYGAIGPKSQTGQFSEDELKQMKGGAEAADSSGITTVKEYNYVAATRLPEVKGISNYTPMADRTVRFAINVWAGWSPIILANNGFKPGKAWKTPGGKDLKVELVLIEAILHVLAELIAFVNGARFLIFAEVTNQHELGFVCHMPSAQFIFQRSSRHRRSKSPSAIAAARKD